MIIHKKRIRSTGYFESIGVGEKIVIGLNNAERFPAQCDKLGFSRESLSGTKLLPNVVNPTTRRNAEPFSIPDKTLPMETAYRTFSWTRHEWAGRGETREVTEYVEIPYKRYPRIEFPPYSMELIYKRENAVVKLFTAPIIFSESNYGLIINTVNMFLTIFGECEVLNENFEDWTTDEIIRLNWDILPMGEYPWERVKDDIGKITSRVKVSDTNRKIMLERCEFINKLNPDFRAYGKSGFNGYIVFGFKDKHCYVLESVYTNNATYVFGENWEVLSQLTKAEILNGNLHNARLIHKENWEQNIESVILGM